jgi:nucleotide-binding universal stress UspA family protein
MIALKKILLATDFSDHSRVALRYAAALAQAFDAEVLVVHVMEIPSLISQLPPTGDSYIPPDWTAAQEAHARAQVEKLLADSGVARIRSLLRTGSPFVEIVAAAREEEVDLIVVGTHGHGVLAHMLLGSVAERVVRKAPCPVLTVREGEHDFVMP